MHGFKSPEGIHVQRVAETLLCPMCNPSRGCGDCRIANGYRQGTPNGVRGRGRERPRATDMEALTGLGGIRKRAHHRFAEIDGDIRKAEALLRHNLSSRGLLRP
ncbi:MAG: hypothetical protein IKO75_12000 [Bacteroidales bacterium]|nr:hypothetical protein [Bacteroidales bacterium]